MNFLGTLFQWCFYDDTTQLALINHEENSSFPKQKTEIGLFRFEKYFTILQLRVTFCLGYNNGYGGGGYNNATREYNNSGGRDYNNAGGRDYNNAGGYSNGGGYNNGRFSRENTATGGYRGRGGNAGGNQGPWNQQRGGGGGMSRGGFMFGGQRGRPWVGPPLDLLQLLFYSLLNPLQGYRRLMHT